MKGDHTCDKPLEQYSVVKVGHVLYWYQIWYSLVLILILPYITLTTSMDNVVLTLFLAREVMYYVEELGWLKGL